MTAYLINDKYLFTGDILSLKDGKIAPIPAFFDMDHAQAVVSMEIIRHILSAEYVFTAHWGYTDDYKTAVALSTEKNQWKYKVAHKNYKKFCSDRIHKIFDAKVYKYKRNQNTVWYNICKQATEA